MSAVLARKVGELSFAHADALVFDPVGANRSATRTSLSSVGFGRVIAVADIEALSRGWAEAPFDLLVADVTQNAAPIFDFVRLVRDGKVGKNPFAHVVLMAWKLDGELAKAALNCGADDLISRPFSVDLLRSRLRTHTEGRKSFVVTSDYVGPDRRREPPRNSPHLMQVPNVLLAKALDGQRGGAAALEEVKAVRQKVDAERTRRCAFKVACLFHTLRDAATAAQPLDGELNKMEATAKDLATRLTSEANKAALEAVKSLLGEVAKARNGTEAAAAIAAIEGLSRTLLDALFPKQDKAQLWQEVEATVATIKAREGAKR